MTLGVIVDYLLKKYQYAERHTEKIKKPYTWALLETYNWVEKNEKVRKDNRSHLYDKTIG